MSLFVYREPVPERVLPAADESAVLAIGAVPMNALQVIGAGIRHDHAGATAPSRASATADAGFLIKIGRCIDDDAREVLGQSSCWGRHIGERTRRVEIVPKVDDPGITHGRRMKREYPRCSSPSSWMP